MAWNRVGGMLWRDTRYPKLRGALTESLRASPDHVIEKVVAAQGLRASAVEDFWDDLGNVVASALPAVGGAVGSIIAPGIGTAIGAGLGSAAGGALHSAIGPAQPSAQPHPAPPQPAYPAVPPQFGTPNPYQPNPYQPNPYQTGAYPPNPYPPAPYGYAPPSSQRASAQLLQMLSQPQMLQALMQMLMGPAGSPTVPVPVPAQVPGAFPALGSLASVPISAFTNMLSELAGQASEAYNAERGTSAAGGVFHYGAGPWGSTVDLASPTSRAETLMHMLREGGAPRQARALRKQRLTKLVEALRSVDNRAASGLG
jgi:hypothetical protein